MKPENMSYSEYFFRPEKGWYKDGYFWRDPNSDGSNGKGDLIANTCHKIIYEEDCSEWAYHALISCRDLLRHRKRWPDGWHHRMDTPTRFGRMVNRTINKTSRLIGRIINRNIATHLPFRYQGRMTRDPFSNWATACLLLDYAWMLDTMTYPNYIWNPGFGAWWKYIKTSKVRYLRRYRFFNRFTITKKAFVIALDERRELAIELIQER